MSEPHDAPTVEESLMIYKQFCVGLSETPSQFAQAEKALSGNSKISIQHRKNIVCHGDVPLAEVGNVRDSQIWEKWGTFCDVAVLPFYPIYTRLDTQVVLGQSTLPFMEIYVQYLDKFVEKLSPGTTFEIDRCGEEVMLSNVKKKMVMFMIGMQPYVYKRNEQLRIKLPQNAEEQIRRSHCVNNYRQMQVTVQAGLAFRDLDQKEHEGQVNDRSSSSGYTGHNQGTKRRKVTKALTVIHMYNAFVWFRERQSPEIFAGLETARSTQDGENENNDGQSVDSNQAASTGQQSSVRSEGSDKDDHQSNSSGTSIMSNDWENLSNAVPPEDDDDTIVDVDDMQEIFNGRAESEQSVVGNNLLGNDNSSSSTGSRDDQNECSENDDGSNAKLKVPKRVKEKLPHLSKLIKAIEELEVESPNQDPKLTVCNNESERTISNETLFEASKDFGERLKFITSGGFHYDEFTFLRGKTPDNSFRTVPPSASSVEDSGDKWTGSQSSDMKCRVEEVQVSPTNKTILAVINNPFSSGLSELMMEWANDLTFLADTGSPNRRYRIASSCDHDCFNIGSGNTVLPSVPFDDFDRLIIHLALETMKTQEGFLKDHSDGATYQTYTCNMVQYVLGTLSKALYNLHNDMGQLLIVNSSEKDKIRNGYPTPELMQVVTITFISDPKNRDGWVAKLSYYDGNKEKQVTVNLTGCCLHIQTFLSQLGYHMVEKYEDVDEGIVRLVCSLRFSTSFKSGDPNEHLERMRKMGRKLASTEHLKQIMQRASKKAYIRTNCVRGMISNNDGEHELPSSSDISCNEFTGEPIYRSNGALLGRRLEELAHTQRRNSRKEMLAGAVDDVGRTASNLIKNIKFGKPVKGSYALPDWPGLQLSCSGGAAEILAGSEAIHRLGKQRYYVEVATEGIGEKPDVISRVGVPLLVKGEPLPIGALIPTSSMERISGLSDHARKSEIWDAKLEGFITVICAAHNYKNDIVNFQKMADDLLENTKTKVEPTSLKKETWVAGSGGAPHIEGSVAPGDCATVTCQTVVGRLPEPQRCDNLAIAALGQAMDYNRVVNLVAHGSKVGDRFYVGTTKKGGERMSMNFGLFYLSSMIRERDSRDALDKLVEEGYLSKEEYMFSLFRRAIHYKFVLKPVDPSLEMDLHANFQQYKPIRVPRSLSATLFTVELERMKPQEYFGINNPSMLCQEEAACMFVEEKVRHGDMDLSVYLQESLEEEEDAIEVPKSVNAANLMDPSDFVRISVCVAASMFLRLSGCALYPSSESSKYHHPHVDPEFLGQVLQMDDFPISNVDASTEVGAGPLPLEWEKEIGTVPTLLSCPMPNKSLDVVTCVLQRTIAELTNKTDHGPLRNRSIHFAKPVLNKNDNVFRPSFQPICLTEEEKLSKHGLQFLADAMFRSIFNRVLGNPVLYHLAYQSKVLQAPIVPGIEDMEAIMDLLDDYLEESNEKNLSKLKMKQHAASVPQSLKNPLELRTFLLSIKHGIIDTTKQMVETKGNRDKALERLVSLLDSSYRETTECWKTDSKRFVAHAVMADIETILTQPFGKVRVVHSAYGGGQGAKLMKLTSEKRRPKTVQEAAVALTEYVWSGEVTNEELLVMGFVDLSHYGLSDTTDIVSLTNGHRFGLTDAEHFLCKAFLIFARLLPSRIHNLPSFQTTHTWPLPVELLEEVPWISLCGITEISLSSLYELVSNSQFKGIPTQCKLEKQRK